MRLNWDTVLVGKRVVLVPYRERYVAPYHAWMQDDALLEQTASERLTLAEERANQASWRDDDKKLTFIAEVEVMVAERKFRRRGFGAEAVELLLAYASRELHVRRFFAKVGDANGPSRRLFEGTLGFEKCNYVAAFKETELERVVEAPLPLAAFATSYDAAPAAGFAVDEFGVSHDDGVYACAVVLFGARSAFCWVGRAGAASDLGALVAAGRGRQSRPAATALVDGDGGGVGAAMAQRLSRASGRVRRRRRRRGAAAAAAAEVAAAPCGGAARRASAARLAAFAPAAFDPSTCTRPSPSSTSRRRRRPGLRRVAGPAAGRAPALRAAPARERTTRRAAACLALAAAREPAYAAALARLHPVGDAMDFSRLLDVWRFNAFESGLYPRRALFNDARDPTCAQLVVVDDTLGPLAEVWTCRAVAKGDALTLSYVQPAEATAAKRHAYTNAHHDFAAAEPGDFAADEALEREIDAVDEAFEAVDVADAAGGRAALRRRASAAAASAAPAGARRAAPPRARRLRARRRRAERRARRRRRAGGRRRPRRSARRASRCAAAAWPGLEARARRTTRTPRRPTASPATRRALAATRAAPVVASVAGGLGDGAEVHAALAQLDAAADRLKRLYDARRWIADECA
ncbi:transferase [Aureococcus anophagefferens]|nr:transferase [Aureococcus anophagefferens]